MAWDTNKVMIAITTKEYYSVTAKCIDSVIANTSGHYDIYVIDAASTDDSVKCLKRDYPSVKIIQMDTSLWPSISWNIALDIFLENNYDYIALLNNDVVVPPNWLSTLIQSFHSDFSGVVPPSQSNRVGAVFPLIVDDGYEGGEVLGHIGWGNTIPPSRFYIITATSDILEEPDDVYVRYGEQFSIRPQSMDLPITMGVGCCFVLSREAVEAVGKFDEYMIFGHDDVEYCYRLWENNYQVRGNLSVRVDHVGGTHRKVGQLTLLKRIATEYNMDVPNSHIWFLEKYPSAVQKMIWETKIKVALDNENAELVLKEWHGTQ